MLSCVPGATLLISLNHLATMAQADPACNIFLKRGGGGEGEGHFPTKLTLVT